MLEGETVEVNPQDHDDLHIQQHILQLEDERKNPQRDAGAIGMGVKHILDHQQQKRTKAMMQALTASVMQSIQAPPTSPEQETIQQLARMYGGPAAGMPPGGAPGMAGSLPGAAAGIQRPNGGPDPLAALQPEIGAIEPGQRTENVGSSAAPVPYEGML
jgi:hypothetical protein